MENFSRKSNIFFQEIPVFLPEIKFVLLPISLTLFSGKGTYVGCSGSSWNLVINFLFMDIILSFFPISQVDITELTSRIQK